MPWFSKTIEFLKKTSFDYIKVTALLSHIMV